MRRLLAIPPALCRSPGKHLSFHAHPWGGRCMAKNDTETAAERFVEKWANSELSERAASHEHFIDLCRLIDQPTLASADATGEEYTFEKPVKVTLSASKGSKGAAGFVDVWKKGCFAWEYKRKDKYKNLDEAYRQLYQYRDALDNPPLSVVCDIRTTEIRTHFPGYPTTKTVVKLEEIPGRLELFRRLFISPGTSSRLAATHRFDVR
jgi:hypothetical protein